MAGPGLPLLPLPAAVEDAGAIGAVHCHGWQTAYRGLLPGRMLDSRTEEKSAAIFARTGQDKGGEPVVEHRMRRVL